MRIGPDTARATCAAAALLMWAATAVAQKTAGSHSAAGLSNSTTLAKAQQVRTKLSSAGFDDIVNLQEREGGAWSCRALRFGTTVRVEVDHDGKISIV